MQKYKRIDISKDQIVPVAERMRKAGVYLVMIHAFIDKEGRIDISWDYAVDPAIESYHVVGEMKVPSVGEIYDTAATWPERELNELALSSRDWTFPSVCSCRRICWRPRARARSWSRP